MIARLAATVLLLAVTTASAEEWTGRVTLYGWLPAADVDTTIDRRAGGAVSGDASSGVDDILDALNFAAFATLEARRGRLGLIGDFVYTDLGFDSTGAAGVRRDLDLSLFMGTGAVAWRAWDDGAAYLDLLGGGRVVMADTEVSRRGPLVSASASSSTSWVDPLVGLRVGYAVTDRVALTALGNVGGFGVGSDLTWELFGGVSYAFTESISGDLGYRYISIDYDSGGTELDTQLYGPAVGLTFTF
jgi:opacity protein-like surface antigen